MPVWALHGTTLGGMMTHDTSRESRDAEASAGGGADDLAQRAVEARRKGNPLQTLLALLILPLSLGLAVLMGIVALVVAFKRLCARLGASR